MEKFFLKLWTIKVEAWQILLAIIVLVVGIVGFGALVEDAARDGARAPGFSKVALTVARIPVTGRDLVSEAVGKKQPQLARSQRFEGIGGFERFEDDAGGALLLSRYDGDNGRSVVEIVNLDDGAVLHRYEPDIRALNTLSKEKAPFVNLARDKNLKRYSISHPYLTEDGGLIFHGMHTPLAKIDVCSNIVWTVDGFFHHSIERDTDGNFWTAGALIPPKLKSITSAGRDDTLVQFSPSGELLFERSFGEILIENGLRHLIHAGHDLDDPLHINDIQPTLNDGSHWRRGDLFVSLRHSNAVLLYRRSTNKIIWHSQGPWMGQHDVDILSDHEITIFNNNSVKLPWGDGVIGVNETLIYDFTTGEITSPFLEGYKTNDIRTVFAGLSEIRSDGEIFVEEANFGRLLKMNAAGEITWQYINRAGDGRNYVVNWSRYIDAELADKTAALAKQKCAD